MKKILFITAAMIIAFCIVAELNYRAAIQDAVNSEGTDSAIEQAMLLHGFDVDAMDCTPITFLDKVRAILHTPI
jgi:hypothetical protein